MAWIIQDTSYTSWSLSDQSLAQKESKIDYFYFFLKKIQLQGMGKLPSRNMGRYTLLSLKFFHA